MRRIIQLIFAIIVIFIMLSALNGCKTVEQSISNYQRTVDTMYINKIQRDSIWIKDSIFIKEKGDTVWVKEWHTKFKDRVIKDTVYQSKTDTVFKEITNTVTKKETPKWIIWVLVITGAISAIAITKFIINIKTGGGLNFIKKFIN